MLPVSPALPIPASSMPLGTSTTTAANDSAGLAKRTVAIVAAELVEAEAAASRVKALRDELRGMLLPARARKAK